MKRKYTFVVGAWLACAGAGAALLVPDVAAAQDDATAKLAKTRYDQGKAAFKKKRYEVARKALTDAYQLAPDSDTALYLGLSSVKVKKYGDGAKYLKKYLAGTQGTSSAEHDQAEAALGEASKKLGTIEVVAPRGTEIFLDGDGDKSGVAPVEPLFVEPGTHSVRGRTSDGATLVQEVKVKMGEKVTAKLGDPGSGAPPVTEDKNERAFTEKPKDESKSDHGGPGRLSPPKTLAPVVIALGVTGVGLVGALVFGLSRGNANKAANTVDQEIRTEATRTTGGNPVPVANPAGICVSSNPVIATHYGSSCATLKKDHDAVGSNALLTNISFGVAGVGAVATIALYLFLPKRDDHPPSRKKADEVSFKLDGVSPLRLGAGQGVGLFGHF